MKKYCIALFLLIGLLLTIMPAPAQADHIHRPRFSTCLSENGSVWRTPCVWDGRHMGDKQGRSFIMNRHGNIRYITHRRAHRLVKIWRNYERHLNVRDRFYVFEMHRTPEMETPPAPWTPPTGGGEWEQHED